MDLSDQNEHVGGQSEPGAAPAPADDAREPHGEGRRIDDAEAAAVLAGRALVEIRYLAGPVQPPRERADGETLDRIRFLADLCHNMPALTRTGRGWRAGRGARPMAWTWNTASPEGQALILEWIEQAGYRWTPPPALPAARKRLPRRTARQRVGALTGRPAAAPSGRKRRPEVPPA